MLSLNPRPKKWRLFTSVFRPNLQLPVACSTVKGGGKGIFQYTTCHNGKRHLNTYSRVMQCSLSFASQGKTPLPRTLQNRSRASRLAFPVLMFAAIKASKNHLYNPDRTDPVRQCLRVPRSSDNGASSGGFQGFRKLVRSLAQVFVSANYYTQERLRVSEITYSVIVIVSQDNSILSAINTSRYA